MQCCFIVDPFLIQPFSAENALNDRTNFAKADV